MAPPLMTWAANSGSMRPNPLMDYAPLRNRTVGPRDRQALAPQPPPPDVFFHARRRVVTPRRLEPVAGGGSVPGATATSREPDSPRGYLKKRSDVTVFHEEVQKTSNNPWDYQWKQTYNRSAPPADGALHIPATAGPLATAATATPHPSWRTGPG
jgi:hypothetical protein